MSRRTLEDIIFYNAATFGKLSKLKEILQKDDVNSEKSNDQNSTALHAASFLDMMK